MNDGAKLQTRKAVRTLVDWLELLTRTATHKARKVGAQTAMVAVFGFFVLVWAELSVYLALAAAIPSYWAALATLGANALVLGAGVWWLALSERREHLSQKAELKRHELVETTSALVQSQVVVPFRKAKMPVAVAGTFVAGVLIARAVVPPPARHSRL